MSLRSSCCWADVYVEKKQAYCFACGHKCKLITEAEFLERKKDPSSKPPKGWKQDNEYT